MEDNKLNNEITFERRCPQCNSLLPSDAIKNKIFCDLRCRTRYNASLRYERIKNDEEYRNKNKQRSKAWRLKNPGRFNELVKQCQARKRLRGK